jgi:hypothetical protein
VGGLFVGDGGFTILRTDGAREHYTPSTRDNQLSTKRGLVGEGATLEEDVVLNEGDRILLYSDALQTVDRDGIALIDKVCDELESGGDASRVAEVMTDVAAKGHKEDDTTLHIYTHRTNVEDGDKASAEEVEERMVEEEEEEDITDEEMWDKVRAAHRRKEIAKVNIKNEGGQSRYREAVRSWGDALFDDSEFLDQRIAAIPDLEESEAYAKYNALNEELAELIRELKNAQSQNLGAQEEERILGLYEDNLRVKYGRYENLIN